MGRLTGFTFDRPGPGSQEVWQRATDSRKVTVPHHTKDPAEGALPAILREGEIDVDAFSSA